MIDLIKNYLPWLMSAITIYMTVLAGNKSKNAWIVGLGNQLLWLTWIIATGTWGLIPMNLALWTIYLRNHIKWNAHHSVTIVDNDELQVNDAVGHVGPVHHAVVRTGETSGNVYENCRVGTREAGKVVGYDIQGRPIMEAVPTDRFVPCFDDETMASPTLSPAGRHG